MNKPKRPASPSSRPAGTAIRARTVAAEDPNTVAESSSPTIRPGFGGLSVVELNDLNRRLAPALRRASHCDALWSVWSNDGDYVAAAAAGIAAAACRAAVKKIHTAWFAIRQTMLEVEGIDRPLVPSGLVDYVRKGETSAQALDRLVAEIEETDVEALATAHKTLRTLRDRSVRERVRRIRACSEWSNPNGILHNHPPEACVILFRRLLVSPPVYMEVRGDLAKITIFRRETIAFREKVEAHEKDLREGTNAEGVTAHQRPTLSGLTREESEQFHDLLDSICAGDIRTRHGKKDSERIATVRLIAEHFRSFLNLSRTAATDLFGVEPWSTGIAELAHAALYFQVTSEEVRGALKNWASD